MRVVGWRSPADRRERHRGCRRCPVTGHFFKDSGSWQKWWDVSRASPRMFESPSDPSILQGFRELVEMVEPFPLVAPPSTPVRAPDAPLRWRYRYYRSPAFSREPHHSSSSPPTTSSRYSSPSNRSSNRSSPPNATTGASLGARTTSPALSIASVSYNN